MTDSSNDPTSFALAACRVSLARSDHTSLLVSARLALSHDPNNALAHRFLAIAAYAQRDYSTASDACTALLHNSSVPASSRDRSYARSMTQALVLLTRILARDPDTAPTAQLRDGWYVNHLQELLDMDALPSLPNADEIINQHATPVVGQHDVVLVRRHGTNTDDFEGPRNRHDGIRFVPASVLRGFPNDQMTGGRLFGKHRIDSFGCSCYDEDAAPCVECVEEDMPLPTHYFPRMTTSMPRGTHFFNDPVLQVFFSKAVVPEYIKEKLRDCLDILGKRRPESPAPKYHNIIDPNVGAVDGLWVPIEVDVYRMQPETVLEPLATFAEAITNMQFPRELQAKVHAADHYPEYAGCKFRSAIPDVELHEEAPLYVSLEKIFESAIPLLAKLSIPSLLLPGPLQVVVKAQRIVLKDGEEYEGMWHDDGLREHVIAVVLFYYHVSDSLHGGGLEFCSKTEIEFGSGDYLGRYETMQDGIVRAAQDIPRFKVDVSEGTMVVFSNYAAVHRVLRMVAAEGDGSRDFVAFFVIDQREPLPIPSTLPPRAERLRKRGELLREQLEPRGHLGTTDAVQCAGNGCHGDLKWLRGGYDFTKDESIWFMEDHFDQVAKASWLNAPVPVLGRGASYFLEKDFGGFFFRAESKLEVHVVGEGDADVHVMVEYPTKRCWPATGDWLDGRVAEEGVRTVRVFVTVAKWRELGVWSEDEGLRMKLGLSGGQEIRQNSDG